jgi:hypothetical protein
MCHLQSDLECINIVGGNSIRGDLQTQFVVIMPDARGNGQTAGLLENFSDSLIQDFLSRVRVKSGKLNMPGPG